MPREKAVDEEAQMPPCPKCKKAGMVMARPKGIYECIGCHIEFKP